jgi:hypothetical protein
VCAEHRDPRFRTGASVTIDAGADAGGGVWVAWEASPFLRQLASDAVRDGRTDDVALWHHGRVMAAMEQSIVAVLRSAGYTVEPDANDMEPFSVLVQGLAEGPLWRDGLDRAATSGPKQ